MRAAALAEPRVPSFDELYAQIERLPQGVTGEILTPGELRTMSRPASAHRHAAKRIGRILGTIDEGESTGAGWWIEIEAEIRFPRDRLAVPDLAAWRVEGVPELIDANPIRVTPDWCCEILSPTTLRVDRLVKLPMYIDCGVETVWLVDPDQRSVEVYVARGGLPALLAKAVDDEEVPLPPFDLPIAVGRLWLPTAPT